MTGAIWGPYIKGVVFWGINGACLCCLRVERRRREGVSQGGREERETERARQRDDHAKPIVEHTDVLTQGCVEVSCLWQYSPSHLSAWKRRREEALTGLLIVKELKLSSILFGDTMVPNIK